MALESTRLPAIVPGPVKIKPRGRNTVVHPFDPVDNNELYWFPPEKSGEARLSPNEVIPYIDGRNAFKDVVSAIRTAKRRGHFIYLVGWTMFHQFQLIDGDASTTIEALFTAADAQNVSIRVMLFHQHPEFTLLEYTANSKAVAFVKGLSNGAAILDHRVVKGTFLAELGEYTKKLALHYVGMHHQKVLIVSGDEGLVAFQGGMDINPDRLHFSATDGLHDVHTRIRGQAALALERLFIERWEDHPESKNFPPIPQKKGKTAIFGSETEGTVEVSLSDELRVKIGRTYANTDSDFPIWPSPGHSLYGPGGPYRFAPKGERTVEEAVLHAISRATKFIYIEDQYLFYMKISDALKKALPNIKKLIILITRSANATDQRQTCRRRKDFIDNLTGGVQPPTDKVIVCENRRGSSRVPFVHSKTFIFDDRFAIVGSANLNRRGYTHDSEQNAGIQHANTAKRFYFAHELRMHLWAKLLDRERPIDLVDAIASSVHWTNPIGHISTYEVNQDAAGPPDNVLDDLIWVNGLDPDGS